MARRSAASGPAVGGLTRAEGGLPIPWHSALAYPRLRPLAGPATLLLAMAGLLLVVPPAGEFLIDIDWNYSRVVERLLERGRLEISPWTATSLVFQAYWGALFATLFGYSQTTLRVSTLVLAAAGVLGFYLLLRTIVDGRRALFGALLLLFNPIYLCRAYSFMTDVPFLALAIWAQYCAVRAVGTRPGGPLLGWLTAASVLAGLAYLTRQIAVALPLAILAALLLRFGWRRALRLAPLLAALGPFLLAVLLAGYVSQLRGPVRQEPLRWTFDLWLAHGPGLVGILLDRLAASSATLGLFVLPLALGALAGLGQTRLTRWRWGLWGALALAILAGFAVRALVLERSLLFPFLGQTLHADGFYTASYFQPVDANPLPAPLLLGLTLLSILGALLLALAAVLALSPATARGPATVPILFALIALGPTLAYHSLYDEYLLAVLPGTVVAVLLAFRGGRPLRLLAPIGLALLAAWSIWWERELLDRQAAVWQAGQALVARGVPPEQIEGGFQWNGWYRGERAIATAVERARDSYIGREFERIVFRKLGDDDPRWALTFRPPNSRRYRVLAEVPYGPTHRVYAIERIR